MDLCVTTSGPATARLHIETMRFLADENIPGTGELSLGMTLQAKIGITLNQHLWIHRTMGVMTFSAPLPHGLMFEHKIAGLLLVAFRTILIQAGKCKTI
jgi:hypothetical protein